MCRTIGLTLNYNFFVCNTSKNFFVTASGCHDNVINKPKQSFHANTLIKVKTCKVQCVFWPARFESVTPVQCEYHCLTRIHHTRPTSLDGINSLERDEAYTTESVVINCRLATNQLKTLETVPLAVLRKVSL